MVNLKPSSGKDAATASIGLKIEVSALFLGFLAMTDDDALAQLKALGDKWRTKPLSTYSDTSLVQELERRGFSCFDMRIETLNLELSNPVEWGELWQTLNQESNR